jgi:uncharacterized membrane protein YoaK (UPF0700 family)
MPEGFATRVLVRAGALCLIAGYVDAVGYTELGGVFAANMTGNSVLLAIAAMRGEGTRVASYALTLVVFLAGAILSSALRRATRRPFVGLVGGAALLLAAAFLTVALQRLALVAFAMGLQGAAITRFGPTTLQTVVVTGTMIRLADNVVEHALPERSTPMPGATRLDALAWLTYISGAALAMLAQRAMGRPLLLAAVALFAVAVETLSEKRAA